MNTTRKAMALMVLGSTFAIGGIAQDASAGSDFRISYSSSSHGYRDSSNAGILEIDGRRFTIRSYNNIGMQIAKAFRRSGYDAYCENGKVIVCFDPCDKPRVCWFNRGYRASIYTRGDRMSISWNSIGRSVRQYQSHFNNHGWGWDRNDRRAKPKRSPRKSPRRGNRRWCD
ncbi:MAG: hypothetical protein ACSHX5_02605 [Phycisphaerales bacterium]